MQDIIKTIEHMAMTGQFSALAITVGCIYGLIKTAETALKIAAGVAAALALIYFFDPSFYSSIANIILCKPTQPKHHHFSFQALSGKKQKQAEKDQLSSVQ